MARASVPAQKGVCGLRRAIGNKKNEQLGMGVIYSKENPKIYHYTHARNGARRVSVSGASD